MSRFVARVLALSLGSVLASVATGTVAMMYPPNPVWAAIMLAKNRIWPDAQTRLDEEAPSRNDLVLAEIERLGDHSWAGVYRSAGIWSTILTIAPDAGYTLYEESRCGNCAGWRGAGEVVEAGESRLALRIGIDWPADRESDRYHLDENLHLVRWDDLLFAVPAWRMESFCFQVNDGCTLPDVPFRYLDEDEQFDFEEAVRPSGRPEVPIEFQKLMLDEPVSCELVSLIECRLNTQLESDSRIYDAVYAIDAGAEQGLNSGMTLFVEAERRFSSFFRGQVDHVDARAARIHTRLFDDEGDRAESLVGRRASTLRPQVHRR